MKDYASRWDNEFHQMPRDKDNPVDIRYADLFGIVLLKRIIDPVFHFNCMSFNLVASRIEEDTHDYDLAAGVLPAHGAWKIVSSSCRLKTPEEHERYREVNASV